MELKKGDKCLYFEGNKLKKAEYIGELKEGGYVILCNDWQLFCGRCGYYIEDKVYPIEALENLKKENKNGI